MMNWYQLDAQEALKQLGSKSQGLDQAEVERRQEEHGANELIERQGRGPWQILSEQFREPMVWLLIVAVGVSLFIHEYLDAGAINHGAVVVSTTALSVGKHHRVLGS